MSSIANVKQAVGWLHPKGRSGCHNCHHASTENTGFYGTAWLCGKHGFHTHAYAICQNWAAREVRGA